MGQILLSDTGLLMQTNHISLSPRANGELLGDYGLLQGTGWKIDSGLSLHGGGIRKEGEELAQP